MPSAPDNGRHVVAVQAFEFVMGLYIRLGVSKSVNVKFYAELECYFFHTQVELTILLFSLWQA